MTLSFRHILASLTLIISGILLLSTQVFAYVESDFYGTWTLVSETVQSPAGEIQGGITNKIVTLSSNYNSSEDYSQLIGYDNAVTVGSTTVNSTCETAGLIQSTWKLEGPSTLVYDPSAREAVVEKNVTCTVTGSASTNAAPRALAEAPTGEWGIKFADNGNTMFATTQYGPSTITHVYTKTGAIEANPNTNNPSDTGIIEAPTQREQSDDENKLQGESDDAWGGAHFDKPISYTAVTDGSIELTPTQQQTLKDQLTADVTNTSNVAFTGDGWENDAASSTVAVPTVTRSVETGIKPQVPSTDITLSGTLDMTHAGLPVGLADANHKIIVTVFSTPIVKIAQADTSGHWTLTVPADLLDEGEHIAYAAAEVNGVRSDQVEITKFIIAEQEHLSGTTWLVIVNGAVAALVVIVLVALQVQHKQKFST